MRRKLYGNYSKAARERDAALKAAEAAPVKRFVFTVDGTVQTSSDVSAERGAKYLVNIEADWRRGLGTGAVNTATSVERVGDVLTVKTTEGKTLVFSLI